MEKDMTVGSPIKLLILFALPLFAGNLFQQLYTMVDTIIVGRFVGADALAAVGSTYGFSYLVINFAYGLSAGFGVIIAQQYGAKDYITMRRAFAQSIRLAFIVGLSLTIVFSLLAFPLLRMIQTPENIINSAHTYILIIFLGLLFNIFYNFFAAVLRAIGDSKSPLIFLIISSVLNIVLDLVLVIYFKMEVAGVAIATVISQGVSAILAYLYIRKKSSYFLTEKNDFNKNKEISHKLLKIGLPGAIQFGIIAIGVIIVQMAINRLGNSDYIAAYSIGDKIKNLLNQFFPAIGIAISTFASQNLGAGKIERISKGFRAAIVLAIIWYLIAITLSFTIAEPLAKLFLSTDGDEQNIRVLTYALDYLRIAVPFFLPLSMIFIFRSGTQGLGSGAIPLISSTTELLMRILAAFFLSETLGLGFLGISFASPTAWTAAAIILPFCYFNRMKKIKAGLIKV